MTKCGAYVILAFTVLAWQFIGMVGKTVTTTYKHYYFATWFAHVMFLGGGMAFAVLTRCFNMEYSTPTAMHDFSSAKVHGSACLMSLLSMLVAMTWFYSLHLTVLSANNAIYQTTPIFVFMLSVCFLQEEIRAYKIVALVVCFSGVLFVSFFTQAQHLDNGDVQRSEFGGYVLVLLSAVLFAMYEVFYHWSFHHERHEQKVENESAQFSSDSEGHGLLNGVQGAEDTEDAKKDQLLNSLLLMGLIGFYNLVALFPGIWVVNAIGAEPLPTAPTTSMLAKMLLLGTVELLYNLFLFAGIAMAGPVFMAVGQVLIVPTSMVFEIVENNGIPPHHTPMNYLGIALILLGFFILQDLKCTRRLIAKVVPLLPSACAEKFESESSSEAISTPLANPTSSSTDQVDVV